MDVTGYTTITRQSGLLREMDVIAHNVANISTTGFRGGGLVFSEFIQSLENGDESLSMANANVRAFSSAQGPLTYTNGTYDFAIEGDGFFLVQSGDEQLLTRAGSFTPNENGDLAAPDGALLLDAGGAPVFVPPDAASITLAADGTLSADGQPLSQVGLYSPNDPNSLTRRPNSRFGTDGNLLDAPNASVVQGYLEGSNVNAVNEIARMIQVQRSYELGQSFLEREDERVRSVIELMSR